MNYRRMLLALFLACGVGQLFGQNKKDHYVLFVSNSSEVTSDQGKSLLDVLSEQAYVRTIRLNAFTDADGSDEFNLALSQRRLTAVRALLVENGYQVSDEAFFGEAKPVASNEVENGKQKNRRVHIQFEYDTKLITIENNATYGTNGLPSSCSRTIVTDLLREELGFEGLIISDALNIMKAVTVLDKAPLLASKAGCDFILMPQDEALTMQWVMEEMALDETYNRQVEESVKRLLRLKLCLGLLH
ncbi:MAG: glycoside hydrolase family 3 N-terminal domain-containing protein [Flavobacteriales bacterium]|nr:glycoside hydrolase family 3 N-terminal domain-containing protein [Flavobacteriales bacterium]